MKYIIFILLIALHSATNTSPLPLVNGGSALTSFTTPNAVICAGTTSTNPWQTTASAGTSGQPLLSGGAGVLPAYATLAIGGGGTGATSLSAGVIQSNGSVLSSLGVGSANQVLQNVAGTVGWAFTNILQMVSTSTSSAIDTAGTSIPDDDTIPQITEGTSILSQAITPKSASSNLLIIFATGGTPNNGNAAIAALFVDSTANALAAQYISQSAASEPFSGVLDFVVASASTTSRTYQIRIGGGDFKVNATSAGARVLGGVASTILMIIEFA